MEDSHSDVIASEARQSHRVMNHEIVTPDYGVVTTGPFIYQLHNSKFPPQKVNLIYY